VCLIEEDVASPQAVSRREKGWSSKGSTDALDDAFGVAEDLVVGKAQHDEAARAQPLIADPVAERLGKVSRTVCLDDEPSFEAYEIADEGPERLLSSKLDAVDATATKEPPKDGFRRRAIPAQLTCAIRLRTKKTGHDRSIGRQPRTVAWFEPLSFRAEHVGLLSIA
jgi:hypothetical protein